jgi:hypothetical protein
MNAEPFRLAGVDPEEVELDPSRAELDPFQELPASFEPEIEFAPGLPTMAPDDSWLVDAADLLAEPDPGPVSYLVEGLIVEAALTAAVGRWKTTKSYAMLELAISIVSGRPAFGELAIPAPGPVVFVIEESGRAALWRRLDALSRGRAITREDLRGLLLAPNERVKLDDADWQARLIDLGQRVQPRLFIFDPLARMKAPARDESAQTDMAAVIEFLRELRDATGAAVAFVHHLGHSGEHMRGSSDLESVWESRLAWTKKDDGLIELASEHREAEAGTPLRYRIDWDATTRTIRFPLEKPDDSVVEEVRAYLIKNPSASANAVVSALGGTRSEVLKAVRVVRGSGTEPPPNHLRGADSAVVRARGLSPVGRDPREPPDCGVVRVTGDDGFPELALAPAAKAGQLTNDELGEALARHEVLERSRTAKA